MRENFGKCWKSVSGISIVDEFVNIIQGLETDECHETKIDPNCEKSKVIDVEGSLRLDIEELENKLKDIKILEGSRTPRLQVFLLLP